MSTRIQEESLAEGQSEWGAGWRVLIAASVGVGIGYSLFLYTAGLFIIPMQQEFQWSRSAVTIGPIVGLLCAFLTPLGGIVIDRYGARPVAIAGLLLLGLTYVLLAATPKSAAYIYTLVIIMACVGTVTGSVIFCKSILPWFPRNSGLALGITLSGLSLVSAVATPILAKIIEGYGWRFGYLSMGALILFVGVPVIVGWLREMPNEVETKAVAGESGSLKGVSLRDAIRDRQYWLCLIAFSSAALPLGGFVSQLQPILISHAFTSSAAAAVGSVFFIAISIGRLAAGTLLDRFRPGVITAIFLAVPAVGAILLGLMVHGPDDWMVAAAAAFLIGLGHGAEADFIAFFTLKLFGMRYFSVIFGTMVVGVGTAIAIGGMAFAALFDLNGSYQIAILIGAAIFIGAALLALCLRVSRG
ncbi:MFS transporter [Sphingobium fluviale]|uniref:MFS transporter n=1 Tax=Sphingobium fluviale TaxID=2506423 RepID=A0A4Q1KHV9_9SPHN|nr:MFS transporter [Sphingobium fluviale]RXR28840.1 MFS transporter [Sphingobium fluviale]